MKVFQFLQLSAAKYSQPTDVTAGLITTITYRLTVVSVRKSQPVFTDCMADLRGLMSVGAESRSPEAEPIPARSHSARPARISAARTNAQCGKSRRLLVTYAQA
jgi:hypothetical protein